MNNIFKISILGTFLLIMQASAYIVFAQSLDDNDTITITKSIDEISVVSKRTSSLVSLSNVAVNMNMRTLRDMPKFMGTADPLRYIESLPCVLTNNETTTGIHIQGCDDYQSIVCTDNAPIYYPNHILGLFSTMIANQYESMIVEQAAHTASAPNRVGGLVNFNTPNTLPKRWNIQGNIGLINSDLTLTLPIGKKQAIWLSGRATYLNLLYSKLISTTDYTLKYSFQDANLTYLAMPTEHDRLRLSMFFSNDNPNIIAGGTDISLPWQNIASSLEWLHDTKIGTIQTLIWFSGYHNKVNIQYAATIDSTLTSTIKSRSYIGEIGTQLNYKYHINTSIALETQINYIYHQCQSPLLETNNIAINYEALRQPHAMSHEASISADMRHVISNHWSYTVGIKASGYNNEHWYSGSIDPRAALLYQINGNHSLMLHYGLYRQYIHKIALINGGLPTDFFLTSSQSQPGEYCHSTELSYRTAFKDNKYSLSAQAYFKQIHNVLESQSDILRLYRSGFDFMQEVIKGDGRNYGVGVMVSKNRGYVTGYVSYSLGWARRQFPELEGIKGYIYAANHDRRHDLSIVINSKVSKRWTISGMFVWATGLPYTKIEEVYILNGQVVSKYGRHNAANLKPYHRLDLSANCLLYQKDDRELTINISLYNVYAHKNQQFSVYNANLGIINGTGMITIIPSLSLYFKF